ncbi:MAG: hypothetical protein Q7R47_02260, partial [Candidatus Diapherotrites archaeon]|nr:hypothetical protein [Candidatus Diapherotrites archaeon]
WRGIFSVWTVLVSGFYFIFLFGILQNWLLAVLGLVQLVSSVRASSKIPDRIMRHAIWLVPSIFLAMGITVALRSANLFGVWLVLYFGLKLYRNVEAFIAVQKQKSAVLMAN